MPTGLGDEQLWISATNDNTGTSTAFNDQSGNGNNGTASGTLVVADTSEGGTYAYEFDGTDDRIDCPSTVLGGSQVFSMSCWVYVDSHDATYGEGFMGQWDNNASSNKAGMIYSGAATSFRGLVTAGGTNYTSTVSGTSPPTGSWHHLASVVDGSNVTLYVDGVSQGATAYSGSISSSPANAFEIGRYQGSFGANDRHCLDGKMDDIRAYNRVLTQAEIVHLAEARGIEGPPPVGLGDEKLWWCPSINDSANDISGNGNDGSYGGNMTTVADTDNGGSMAYFADDWGDYVAVDQFGGPLSESRTVSYWIKRVGTGSYTEIGTARNYFFGGGNNRWVLQQGSTYVFWSTSSSTYILSSPVKNTWEHVTIVRDNGSGDAELYLDGTLVDTWTPSAIYDASTDPSDFFAGMMPQTGNATIDLYMDDIRTYDRTLTQAEITHLASGRGTTGDPLVGLGSESLWVSPTLTTSDTFDITGNGNTALIDGTVPVVEDTTGYESFQTDNTTLGTDYVYFDSPTGTTDPAAATIAFWAKSNFSVSYAPIGGFCTSGFNDLRFFIARKSTTGSVRIYRKTTSSGVAVDDFTMPNGSTDFFDQNMHHWCLVFEGGKNKLYFDGVFIGESPSALSDNLDLGSTNFSLGSQDGRGTAASASNYDDIRFYDSALTPAEVFHLSTSRGVQGTSDIPAGLGTETGWWMPTYSEDNPNTPNIASSTLTQYNIVPTNIDSSDFVVDTDNGGEWAALSTYSTSINHENRVVTGIKSQVFDTGGWTMTGWVKTVSPTNTQHLYDTDGGWVFRMQNGVFRLLGGINFTTTTTVPNNQWFHFAMSVDSNRTNYKFYMDGVLEETHTDSAFPTTGTDAIYISAQQSGNYNINGRWDDFRLFDTQISDADVATLASSRGAGGSAPPSSVFFNPFKSQAFHTLIGQRIR